VVRRVVVRGECTNGAGDRYFSDRTRGGHSRRSQPVR
jgi:hypothetical protein